MRGFNNIGGPLLFPVFEPDIDEWLPTITFSGGNGDLNVVYSTRSGRLTILGNLIFGTFNITTTTFTYTTAAGNYTLTGLPANLIDGATRGGSLMFSGITKAGYTCFVPELSVGPPAAIALLASGSGVAQLNVTAADMPSGTNQMQRGWFAGFVT